MSNAPSCPISFGQPIPGKTVFHRGEPWRRPGDIQDLIDSIPRAHDLRSAIFALNRMKNIITMINRGEPVVNNINVPKEPDVKFKGEKHDPNYQNLDWVQEGKEFEHQELKNPEDQGQKIAIDTVKFAKFFNGNTSNRLTYFNSNM